MEGKALIRLLKERNYNNIINLEHGESDLTDYNVLEAYFKKTCPEYIFIVAGKSGGIKANQEMPATLMLDNLRIISNVLSAAHKSEVEKLLYLASSCVYPKHAEQPMLSRVPPGCRPRRPPRQEPPSPRRTLCGT